jgi:predicted RNA-binding Zn-ribbon protein involved in translation (DUF1610 family)
MTDFRRCNACQCEDTRLVWECDECGVEVDVNGSKPGGWRDIVYRGRRATRHLCPKCRALR